MFLRLSGKTFFLSCKKQLSLEIEELLLKLHTNIENFIFCSGGKQITSFENLRPLSKIQAFVPLKGGKGGYGAKMKTQDGKKVKPNNNMFRRDMSGRRLIYATMQKQFRKFVNSKQQQDKRVAQERQQFKIMQNTLKERQSFMKLDKAYKNRLKRLKKIQFTLLKLGNKRLWKN